ncbi:MAG TPA: hypothetical protein EYG93_00285 [Sulfurospirillum arcachonense]|nr:hypothetical protein [Sulfurospirillum arcachonense]HIP43761.1 hypothetical protein [Sulfurospirillum arcachonense]
MKSLQNIFSATIKESKEDNNLPSVISELTFELSKKKIQRLKDDSHIQARLGELFEFYTRALQSENLENSTNIDAIISGLIKAASYDKEEFLYKSLYEKEQLEKSINKQKESIKNTIMGTFDTLEAHIENMDKSISIESLKALHNTKLRGVEMLGILKETTSEAILTTLEKGKDVEDTVFEITKNITYQTIKEGDFSKTRILEIANTILNATIEIADEEKANAKALLNGAVHGTKEGMAKAIDKFKNDLKFAPEELATEDLKTIKKDLSDIDNAFVEVVKSAKKTSVGLSVEIIENILNNDIDNSLSKVKRVAIEARETLSEKIDELKLEDNEFLKKAEKKIEELEKIASKKIESIKQDERTQNATKEAKRLGNHAWEVAKSAVESAIKSAKDVINKK